MKVKDIVNKISGMSEDTKITLTRRMKPIIITTLKDIKYTEDSEEMNMTIYNFRYDNGFNIAVK